VRRVSEGCEKLKSSTTEKGPEKLLIEAAIAMRPCSRTIISYRPEKEEGTDKGRLVIRKCWRGLGNRKGKEKTQKKKRERGIRWERILG